MGTGRYVSGGAGIQTAGLIFGGNPGMVVTTEEWTFNASVETVAFD